MIHVCGKGLRKHGKRCKRALRSATRSIESAERLAVQRELTRRALYAQALEALLNANEIDPLTEATNRVADAVDTRLDPALKRLQNITFERHG